MNKIISHKELLTFSNLTNLDWHFVLLKDTKQEEGIVKEYNEDNKDSYKKLNDLLKPELFVRIRKDEKGEEIREPVYGEGEEGIIKLRQKAGIAMEYLEKWQEYDYTEGKRGIDEGSFLQDWEVIYAADNYKVYKRSEAGGRENEKKEHKKIAVKLNTGINYNSNPHYIPGYRIIWA